MRVLTVFAGLFLLSSYSEAQQCTFKDSGFQQCVTNYTNWVQVQLAQIQEFTVRILEAIPEPKHVEESELPHRRLSAVKNSFHKFHKIHTRSVDVASTDYDNENAPAVHQEKAVPSEQDMPWSQFKQEVISIVKTVIANGSAQLANGVRTLTHNNGVHDVRSLICIYSSVNAININGSRALQDFYKKLSKAQRPRFEKAVAVTLIGAGSRISEVNKNMVKEVNNCYFLLV